MTAITRRSALKTTTLSALGVGLMAAAGAPVTPVAANAQPAPALSATISLAGPVTPVDAAWLATWRLELDELHEELKGAEAAIKPYLPGDGFELLSPLDAAENALAIHEQDLLIEQIAIHLPGIAPALRAVYHHVTQVGAYSRMLDCCGTIPTD